MDHPNQLQAWYDYASADLDAAERLLQSPNPNNWTFLLAAWHCHQAIEKMIKMVIISQNKENLKVHDLLRLADLAGLEFAKTHLDLLRELNQFYSPSRYPDLMYKPFPSLDQNKSQTILDLTKELFVWLNQQVQN